jgi:hypothetical protein
MLTNEQRQTYINTIRGFPAQFAALVSGLNEEQLTTPYLEGEWTVAQNVHHVADSHMNCYIRMKLLATEDRPTLKPYDQDVWAALPDGSTAELAASLTILQGLHRRWSDWLASLGEQDWQRVGYHPEIGDVTLDDLLRSYAAHGQAHIDQITRTLAAQPA